MQHVSLLLNAGFHESVQGGLRQRGEFLHHWIQLGIPNGGVPDIVVGPTLIVETGLRITFDICRWYQWRGGQSEGLSIVNSWSSEIWLSPVLLSKRCLTASANCLSNCFFFLVIRAFRNHYVIENTHGYRTPDGF